ncbi:MAG TPA: hypothetical protein VGH73_16800 [Thermoanaerobaculia bacterium]
MRPLWRRLLRLRSQSRIRLPRRSLIPEDLQRGDRLQIGPAVFRVGGRLRLRSGPWAFRLEEFDGPERGPVRLLASEGTWTLVRGGRCVAVPVDCVVRYPAGNP